MAHTIINKSDSPLTMLVKRARIRKENVDRIWQYGTTYYTDKDGKVYRTHCMGKNFDREVSHDEILEMRNKEYFEACAETEEAERYYNWHYDRSQGRKPSGAGTAEDILAAMRRNIATAQLYREFLKYPTTANARAYLNAWGIA